MAQTGQYRETPARAHEALNRDADLHPSKDIIEYLKEYARENPEAAALWCFGLGFVIGWKLKPW
jgi:hypothetical protein